MLGFLRSALLPLLVLTSCHSSGTDTTPPTSPAADGDRTTSSAGGGHETTSSHDHPHAQPNTHHDGHAHHRHHRFEDAEQWATMFDDPSRDEWQRPEQILDFMQLTPQATVADLGAGTGYFAVRLARRVPDGRVFANDIEPDMVRYLTERARKEGLSNLVAVQGSADDPAIPEAVDVAFMCNVYHHIADRMTFFGHVVDTLGPDGRLVIVDFKKDAPEDAPGPPPAMRVAQDELIEQLSKVGLTVVRADRQLLPHQYIVELSPTR